MAENEQGPLSREDRQRKREERERKREERQRQRGRQEKQEQRQQAREQRKQERGKDRGKDPGQRQQAQEDRNPKRNILLERVPAGGVCAEVGVWKGDFSDRILRIARPQTLHLVDPWHYETGEDYEEALYGGQLESGQADMDAIHAGVAERFAAEIAAGTVIIHRAPSAEAVNAFPDHSLDWVYIDGNHLYEYVLADLQMWSKKVKPGGVLAGDDYHEGGWWEGGVKRAVDEFAAERGYEPTIMGRQFMMIVS